MTVELSRALVGLVKRGHVPAWQADDYHLPADDFTDDLNDFVIDEAVCGRRLPRLFEELPFRFDEDLPAATFSDACPIKPRRSLQTTNTERILADLESDVVNGLMTPAEADAAFGRKPAGSKGRPRAAGQETFAAWLRSRIAKLSDPAALAELVNEARRLQTDRTMRRAARAAAARVLNRNMTTHDPDYIDQLRAALAEVEDPLSAAA